MRDVIGDLYLTRFKAAWIIIGQRQIFQGKMQLHRSETAFAMLMAVILVAVVLLALTYIRLVPETAGPDQLQQTRVVLLGAGILLGTALVVGVLFIYPIIRTQAKEGGHLREMTASLKVRSKSLENAALTDALTGLRNRRYFDDALLEYLDEFGRIGRPVGLMILDLDHFKMVNDTYGHDIGDDVLRAVGKCLGDMTTYHDVVARLGGEEFAVVTPNVSGDAMSRLAERIRKAISLLPLQSGSVRLKVTTSVGVAIWDGKEGKDQFYRRADAQLYEAKRNGRNMVCA